MFGKTMGIQGGGRGIGSIAFITLVVKNALMTLHVHFEASFTFELLSTFHTDKVLFICVPQCMLLQVMFGSALLSTLVTQIPFFVSRTHVLSMFHFHVTIE